MGFPFADPTYRSKFLAWRLLTLLNCQDLISKIKHRTSEYATSLNISANRTVEKHHEHVHSLRLSEAGLNIEYTILRYLEIFELFEEHTRKGEV